MRPRTAALAAVTAALTLVTGCAGASGPATPAGPSATSAPPTTVAQRSGTAAAPTTATPARTPTRRPGEVTLAFGGDVHFADALSGLLDDPAASLADLRPLLGTADLAMVNLETAITTRGSEMPKKFHFRAPATALDTVRGAGVDVVTMANNHAVDYGEVGLKDTLAARAASPIPVVGIGRDAADAYGAAVLDAAGTRLAVLGATQVPDWTLATWPARAGRPGVASASSPERLAAAVRATRRKADVVVVYLHWGTDYTTCPNALQKRTARALADAGADVVVGAHAHRVQGAGWLGRTYVSYGLGNFVWWKDTGDDARTGVLTLTLRGRTVRDARWTPLTVRADGVPRAPEAATSARMLAAWEAARGCTGLAARPSA